MRMRGPLGVAGLLTLSNESLSFEPSGRLDRLIGERNLRIQTGSIDKVSLAGIERTLTVFVSDTGGQEYRFAGRGAARMHLRLESMISQRLGKTASLPSGEQPLIEGAATLYNNNLIATRGDLVLTKQRFLFTPRDGLETHIWSFPKINVPLSQINQTKLSGVKKLLEIWINDERFLFGGAIVEELNKTLNGLGLDFTTLAIEHVETIETVLELKASLHGAMIPTTGLVRVTNGELTFAPTGRLGLILGATTQTIQISAIEKMEVVGTKKLTITSSDDEITLRLSNPRNELLRIIPKITSCLNRELQSLEAESGGFEQLLSLWESELHLTLGEPIVLTAPVVFWQNENTAICGWLGLTDTRVFFLPLTGPDRSGDVISIDLTTIISSMESRERSNKEIYLVTHKREFHFTPLTALGFVEAFWILSEPIITEEVSLPDHFERSSAIRDIQEHVSPDSDGYADDLESPADLNLNSSSLRRLVGELSSMTLYRKDQAVLHLSPAITSVQVGGVSILIDRSTCVWFEEGEPIYVQFTREEGTYSFHTTVMAVKKEKRKEEGDEEDTPIQKVLFFRKPRTLKFLDRRLTPRAHFPPLSRQCSVDVTGLPGFSKNKIKGYVRDLSTEGCSVQLSSFVPEKLVVLLTLNLGDTTTSVSAICHHITPPSTIDGSWFFGLRFTNNSEEDRSVIHNEIVANINR